MKKLTPEEKAALKEQKQKEAEAQEREDRLNHKNAKLTRCTYVAYGKSVGYVFLMTGLLVVGIALIVVGILIQTDPDISLGSVPLYIIGGIILAAGIAFGVLYALKRSSSIRWIPILAKQVELLTYECQHPDEPKEAKAKRYENVKTFYQKLLNDNVIREKDYEKAIKELGFKPEPKPEEPVEEAKKK